MANQRENLAKLGAIMVREATRSFVSGCLVTKTAISRVKNVGPIQISTDTSSLSLFQKAIVDFVNLQLPEALDSERAIFMDKQVGRHAKASEQIRTLYACTQVVYLGDSIAAALAHRNKVSASYLELYTFNDLRLVLNHIYLNRNVETVFVSVGRTDINDYYAHEARSTYRLQMENFTETFANNFPHVRVVWIHPTILVGTDPDQELYSPVWEQHINENSVDTFYDDASTEPANERMVECQLPKIMGDAIRSLGLKDLTDLEEIEYFQDHCGNLKPQGVQMLTQYFLAAYGLDYWHADDATPTTPVEELRVPAFHQWKVKAPVGQAKPPVGGRLNLVPYRRVPAPMEISVYPSNYATETRVTQQQTQATASGTSGTVATSKPVPRTHKPAVQMGFQDDFGSYGFFGGPNTAYVQSRTAGGKWMQTSPKPFGSGASSMQQSQTPTPTPPPAATNPSPKPKLPSTAPAPNMLPPPTAPWTFGQGSVPPGFQAPVQPGPMVPGWYPYPSPYGAPMPGMPYYQMQPQTMPQMMGMAPINQPGGQQPQGGSQPQTAPAATTAYAAAPIPPTTSAQQPPPQPLTQAQLAALLQNPQFMQMAMGFHNQQQPPTSQ
ncbi:hypothetical protein AAVH_38440 [Aphelenchoides avenae]|nr:hypothetical protein AAVH_38440 [Aphelenchus avenae]